MDLEQEDEIVNKDTDILIINKGRGGINIREDLDEGNK